MPAGTMFQGKPEKVNPATPPPTVAVPLGVLRLCRDLLNIAARTGDFDPPLTAKFDQAQDDLQDALNQYRPA
jgi:hypothetical protein